MEDTVDTHCCGSRGLVSCTHYLVTDCSYVCITRDVEETEAGLGCKICDKNDWVGFVVNVRNV